jgi:hypothetical protein
MSVFVNKIVVVYFFFFTLVVNAQVLPVWYKVHGVDPRKVSFVKFIKNNSTFSLVKVLDTVSVPEATSVFVLDKEGKFVQELSLDTAAYCNSKEQIVAGKKKNGRMLIGISTLKEETVIPMEYLEIRFYKNLFAVKNTEYLWAVFEKGNRLSDFVYTDMSFTSFGKIKVKDKRGAGILSEDGSLLFDNIYGEIEQITVDSFLLKEQDRWTCQDRSKNELFSWRADSVKALNDSLYFYYSEGRVFIKDSTGLITGSEKGYHRVEKINNRLIQITLGEYSGLIDLNGKEILPIRYYEIRLEKSGHIKALGDEVRVLRYGDVINKNKRRWSLHDSLGRKVLAKQYRMIRSFREGMIAFQNDENLWGFANEKGMILIEPRYQYASDFKNGYALVRYPNVKENDYRLINLKQELIFTEREAQLYYLGVIRYRSCEDSLREGEPESELFYGVPPYRYDRFIPAEYGYIRTKNGSYTGVLDSTGKEAVQAYQDTVYLASSDTFFLYKRNNGLIGYSDRYCNTTLALTNKFEGVQPLQNGFSKFKKEGLYGFIDPYGNVHVAPKYTACGEFQDGMASVFLKGKWGFIDKEENLTVQPYYKEVKSFRNGFAPVKNIKNKWIFIDKKGTLINTSMYDDFRETKNGKYLVFKNKRWGITTAGGKEILSPKYEYIEEISPALLKIKKDGKFGVMDFQENIILYYQYDDVIYDPYRDRFFVKFKGSSRKVGVSFQKK